ncbi:CE290 protein, partial [Amia calva]|nr:CE290 protein [Amia calva]
MAQRSMGGRDTRFLRDEIRQLENQLERREKEMAEMEKEINKEKKANEELTLRAEEAENENRKLKRENEQFRQDVIYYRRELDQREPPQSTEKEREAQAKLTGLNRELHQCLDELQMITDERDALKAENEKLEKYMAESSNEMISMSEEYVKMKTIVQQTDSLMDQLRKEREQLRLQVQELTEQIQARSDEDDPVMAAVNAKVDEWKRVLSSKDEEIVEYQQMIRELKDRLRMVQLDSDKKDVMALQQAVQERDSQIKMLTDQVEQYTSEMERNAEMIEELKKPLQKDRGPSMLKQQSVIEELKRKIQDAERKVQEAKREAEMAISDAGEKDKELSEALARMRAYEAGEYGLENAVAEIKECKKQIKLKNNHTESLIKDINKLEMKINDLLEENEDFRERLGLNPNEVVDLTEFRRSKALKLQQCTLENKTLLNQIASLDEERLNLKRHIRRLAKDKDDTQLDGDFQVSSSVNLEEIKRQNDHLLKELRNKEMELKLTRTESAQSKERLSELSLENKQLDQGMKEILQAIKEYPKNSQRETGLNIPSLERLVSAIEMKNADGKFDASVHLKAQVDQLTGRNFELRNAMTEARKEASNALSQLLKANEKIVHLESEVEALRQSGGSSITFKTLNLPEEMAPSSMEVISSLNEYAVRLLQELNNKEESTQHLEEVLEEYKHKFAVIRHQQGLLYKEYQSEREAWQKEKEKATELIKKAEEQKEVDAVRIKEFNHWLEVLQTDPSEIKKQVSEAARKMTVLRVNEKSLTRRYTTLLEMEQHLRKENNKLKNESIAMESAVADRVGYLQRYKDMAAFKIAALQKALDDSVSSSELERSNKLYNELTSKYRDVLQKDNLLVQKTMNLEHLEGENLVLQEQINGLNKELEITKEKLHTLEQAWEHITKLGGESSMDKATKAITNSEIVSISKKITMLEMKELNERQRAEHAHKMYEHLRSSLKQVEDRNFELESKFAELSKQNLEAQKIEQELRDELASSVSKAVSDAHRRRITELEKIEAELKIEVSKLREVSDVAKAQVSALESHQQSREKEVESLRKQVLDYQAHSDERALIAKLHQHIVALQVSEATAVSKLEAAIVKVQKLEAYSLRMEQKLDDKEQALYYARLEGRNRAKHLRQTVQALRRQFSGALPLPQQEKFSKTMIQLQNDKLKVMQDIQSTKEDRRKAEEKALELEVKMKGLEELLSTLKDAKGAQKVIEWHKKIEDLHLQDLKHKRELASQNEEIKYLKSVIAELERTTSRLEEEIVQQNIFHEEQQLSWDQREVELERQLDLYERQHNEVLSTAQKFEEALGALPDPSLPLPHQLDFALGKIKEHVRTILETRGTCKTLEEKLKEKEAALWEAEQNVLSRDKVINELRLRLPATAEREKLIAELGKREDDPEYQQAIKVAHQTIANLQARLNQKEDVLKKYQNLLARARQEQEDIAKKHEAEVKVLHEKLDLHSDTSLHKFKQTALELMQRPSMSVPTSKHLVRLAEMEQTVAEQDNSLSNLTEKLKRVTAELERQRQITALKIKEHADEKTKLEERQAAHSKRMREETDALHVRLSQMEKEVQYLNTELEAQKEANIQSPTSTMKNLVERLKSQLALKEKQQKALSKALLELRSEMTSHAEQQIIASAAQKEENLNVQQIVDKHTKDLKSRVQDLSEELQTTKENLKICKTRENSVKEEVESLNRELQRSHKTQSKLQAERDELHRENGELQKKIKRLMGGLQNKADSEGKGATVDELQKKVQRLESELERKTAAEQVDRKNIKEDKTSKEEIIRWEESKKWQGRLEGVRNKLKEKEKEVETLTKQLSTLKDLYARIDQEKASLLKKIKTRGVTVDQVVGARTLESEKEIEELKRHNSELEHQIVLIKQQQALPRDVAMEELNLKNRYLEEKLNSFERQLSKESLSRPSTSGRGTDTPSQREHELQRENLKLSSENLELRFQLEQTNKDLPRLKDQVANLKEMCDILKKEKADLERKLGNVRGSGRSGKTVPELEKTIGLMKKVVERVQRENESLKKAPGVVSRDQLTALVNENEKLKSEYEKLKLQMGGQLSMRYESKTKGMEKIIAENERLRMELKKETEAAEKLRIAKNNVELTNEKLMVQLEETSKRLSFAETRGPQLEGADSKSWKSIVVTRMYESKMKELESDIVRKNSSLSDLKQLLREAAEREQKNKHVISDLKEQIELLKHFPEEAKTESGLVRELQLTRYVLFYRLTNSRLEKEKVELVHELDVYRQQSGAVDSAAEPGYDELLQKAMKHDTLMEDLVDMQTQLKSADLDKRHLQEEVKKMKKELENFDPTFFEEIEDLKFNYNLEVKKNILLEEKLKTLSDRFGLQVDIPTNVSID